MTRAPPCRTNGLIWGISIVQIYPKRSSLLIALSLGSACVTAPAFASESTAEGDVTADAPASADADIVVRGRAVQATELASDAIDFGNAVQIVTSTDIQATGATNFAELAQFLIRGANIGYSPDEGEYTIRLDGGGDRDTLVVLDGVPLYDRGPALEDIWGSTTIDPHMIERVEVFRGGNSLFFGSNGGIGVISIVTKRPDGERGVEFGAQYGDFNTREIWGNARFPIDPEGRHSFMVYGSSLQTDGPRIFAPESFVDNVAAAGGIQKYPLNRNNVGAKYLFKVDDKSEFRLNGQYTQIEFQDAFPDNETFSPNRVRYPIVDFGLDRRWSDMLYTELTGYWSNPKLNNTETFAEICRIRTGCINPDNQRPVEFGRATGRSIAYPNKGFGRDSKVGGFQELGLNFRNTVTIKDVVELVGGVQVISYKNDSDPVFRISDAANTVTGVYLDARPVLPFSPDTNISLAVRTDFAKSFGSRTIWKFGARQPIGSFYLRANGGTSYSLPRTNELFADSPTLVGNPDLRTEETETYNAGIGFSKSFGNVQLSGEASYFRTDISDRIQSTSGLTVNTFFNNEAVTQIRGLAAYVDFTVGQSFSANISYTRQRAQLAGTDLQINETPLYFITGQLAWHGLDNRLHINLFPRYQGPEFSTGGPNQSLRTDFGNYFLMNGSVGLWLGDDRQHRFQLRVVNLFNEKYAERFGFGNQRFSVAAVRGELRPTDPGYFYGYPFEGKPRAFYVSYNTRF
jgi:iron complex outermembrane receptor protein